MKRRFLAAALTLAAAGPALSLDANSQRMADRYRSILAANPGQQTSLDRLWEIYHKAGETDALVESAREQADKSPVLSARILQRAGKSEEAGKVLDQAVATGDVAAIELRAAWLEGQGDFTAAAAVLDAAAATRKNPQLLAHLGELSLRAGDVAKSRAAWEEAVTLAPDDLVLRKKLAAASAQAGDASAAVVHLRVIAEKGSPTERFAAWEEISRRLADDGKPADALAAQEALLALMGPGHWKLAAARQRLFHLHEQAGTLAGLEKKWQAEAESRPRDPEPALRMAELAGFRSDDAQRLVWLRQASEALPKDAALAGEVAALELSAGNSAAAAALYDRLLAVRPQDENLIFQRAEVSALSGQVADAEKRVADYLATRQGDENATARATEFFRRLRLSAPLEKSLTDRFRAAANDEAAATELARFFLEQHRDKDVTATLERFDDSGLDPKEAAAVALRFSELLRDARMNDEALVWARKAFARDPSRPEYALHLTDLLNARNEPAAVREVLEKACAAAPNLPREDLERRLHSAVQAQDDGSESLMPDEGVAMRKMLASLREQAAAGTGGNGWLRLARWQRWNSDPKAAVEVLREGFSRHPDSLAIRDALASALAESGDTVTAIAELRKLAEVQPEKAVEFQRRIGHLQLDGGQIDEGLATFEALGQSLPKDWQAAADLALAEQMAGNWFRALETWRRAYGLAPAGSRQSLHAPILNAAARLQLFDQGLDFLEEACAAERDGEVRAELLREAAAFAVQNRVAPDWRARLENRGRTSPGDISWKTGLVFLLEEEGRGSEARRALVESRRGGEQSEEDLQALLVAAEKAGDWKEAAQLLKRLIAAGRTPDPALAIRHAEYLERAGEFEEARAAWLAVAARHARTPAALIAAADFFERTGDEARMESNQRAAARLGGCPPGVPLRLGKLALERGDRLQALADFEAVLQGTRSDPAAGKDCLPLPERIVEWKQNPGPSVGFLPGGMRTHVRPAAIWRKADDSDTEGCRLLAIQQAGQLLANSPDKPKWLEGFTQPVERIWAAYYSGETAAAFAEMERLVNADDSSEATEQAFASVAMEAGQGAELGRWAAADSEKSVARWDNVLAALARMLDAGWRPTADEAEQLFAAAPALKRWQAAQAFATRNLHRTACVLGDGVPADLSSSQAVSAWMELSKWRLALRDPEGMISRLDQAIAIAPPAVSFASPLFGAIRARWLLTPPDQRPAFEQSLAARWQNEKQSGYASTTRALLAALKGDDGTAAREIAALFAGLGVAEGEGWSELVQQGGLQLEEWNLHRLARELYRQDLARDPALLAMRGENFRRATEGQFILNHLAAAPARSVPYLLKEWLARGATDEELLQAANRLQHSGRLQTAASVFEKLCERDSRNDSVCAGIINLSGVPAMRKPAMAFLERLLAGEDSRMRRPVMESAALRLSSLWDEEGDSDRALATLERADGENAPDRGLVLQRVQILCRMGKFREALELLEKNAAAFPPSDGSIALPLAELYAGLGREREARALLQKEADGPKADRLAIARLHELDGSSPTDPPLAPVRGEWEKLVKDLDAKPASREERFRSGREFLSRRDVPEDLRRAELARLKQIATRHPDLLPQYFLTRLEGARISGTAPALEKELVAEWNDGRGSYFAGEILIQLLLEQKRYDDFGRLLDDYLTDNHFNERAWDQIGQSLLTAGQPALAARVFSGLAARSPGDSGRAVSFATALWKSGQQAEAREILAPLERIAALDAQKHFDLAQFALNVDDPDDAQVHLLAAADVLRGNARAAGLWEALAGQFIGNKQFDQARAAMVRATENNPQALSPKTVADFYERTVALADLAPDQNEFLLPSRPFRDLRMEIVARLIAAGNTAQAWVWLESAAPSAADARWRELLQGLETNDPARAGRLWESAAQSGSWDVRLAAAQFYLRRAQASPSSALKDLARAHELHSGSFAIASAYATELLRLEKPAAARQALQDVIAAYSPPADRRAARAMLASLQASPALPNEG